MTILELKILSQTLRKYRDELWDNCCEIATIDCNDCKYYPVCNSIQRTIKSVESSLDNKSYFDSGEKF